MPTDIQDRLHTWAVRKWPKVLVGAGLFLFALACLNSARLPVEALLVGPAMMLAGVVMTEWNQLGSRRRHDGRSL